MAKPAAKNIANHTLGDHLQVLRTNPATIPAGEAVAKAWFTVKANVADGDPGLLQKSITVTPSAAGEIIDDGASSQAFDCRFEILRGDQTGFSAGVDYEYDVQVLLSPSDEVHTLWRGTLSFATQVTEATA